MARKQSNSRQARWERACGDARTALEAVEAAKADLETALQDLADVQSEYQDWLDNLPDGLRYSPVGEKLEAVTNIDLDWDGDSLDAASQAIDEAEGADLPLGWGRD